MEEKLPDTISRYEHERTTAILERGSKRLLILCIIIFCAFVGTNVGWIIYESQFEDVVTVTQDVKTETAPAFVNATGEMVVNDKSATDSY